jgi:hypothetical protein
VRAKAVSAVGCVYSEPQVATAIPPQSRIMFPSVPRDMLSEYAVLVTDRRIVWCCNFPAMRKHVSLFLPCQKAHPSGFHHSSWAPNTSLAADTFHRAQFGSRHSLTILTVFRSSKGVRLSRVAGRGSRSIAMGVVISRPTFQCSAKPRICVPHHFLITCVRLYA